MHIRSLLAVVTLTLIVSVAYAEPCRSVDQKGATALRDANAPATASKSVVAKKEGFTGTVELYVTSWCGYCRAAQNHLKQKGVPYVAYDIEKDDAAKQRHRELGGKGVPLIIVGSHKMSGYSEEMLDYYLSQGE